MNDISKDKDYQEFLACTEVAFGTVKGLLCTEYARGAKNRLLWYATHFQGHSVRRTGFSGTGVIFGTGNRLLWYAARFQGHSVRR